MTDDITPAEVEAAAKALYDLHTSSYSNVSRPPPAYDFAFPEIREKYRVQARAALLAARRARADNAPNREEVMQHRPGDRISASQDTSTQPGLGNKTPPPSSVAGAQFDGHTQGPWQQFDNGGELVIKNGIRHTYGPEYADCVWGPQGPGRGVICDCSPGSQPTPDSIANARLIAAAPALLAERDALRAKHEADLAKIQQQNTQMEADYDETEKIEVERDALRAQVERLREVLVEIEWRVMSLLTVNDSESLGHTIRTIQHRARAALGEKP
jgi:hypothetical protein